MQCCGQLTAWSCEQKHQASMSTETKEVTKHYFLNQSKPGMLVASPQHAHVKNGIFFPFSAAQNGLSALKCPSKNPCLFCIRIFCIHRMITISIGGWRKESVLPEQHTLISNTRNDQTYHSFSFQRKYPIFKTTLAKEKTWDSND